MKHITLISGILFVLVLVGAVMILSPDTEAAPRMKAGGAALAQGRVTFLNPEGAVMGGFYAEAISFAPNCEAVMVRTGETWFYWDFESSAVVVNPQLRASQYQISWALGNGGAPDWVTGRQWPWMIWSEMGQPMIDGNEPIYRGNAVEIITCGMR